MEDSRNAEALESMSISTEDIERITAELNEAETEDIRVVDLTGENSGKGGEFPSTSFSFYLFYKTPKGHKIYDGQVLQGVFTGHVPTIKDRISMARIRDLLRPKEAVTTSEEKVRANEDPETTPVYMDTETELLIATYALLKVCLDDHPKWFDVERSVDLEQIIVVGGEVQSRINSFRGSGS